MSQIQIAWNQNSISRLSAMTMFSDNDVAEERPCPWRKPLSLSSEQTSSPSQTCAARVSFQFSQILSFFEGHSSMISNENFIISFENNFPVSVPVFVGQKISNEISEVRVWRMVCFHFEKCFAMFCRLQFMTILWAVPFGWQQVGALHPPFTSSIPNGFVIRLQMDLWSWL